MATDCIYRKTTGSASMDCADMKFTGAISPDGDVNATGAGYFTAGIRTNGTVVSSNGTAPTLPAGVTAFFGSGGANHAIVFPTAIGMQGRTMFVYEYGSGTTTATGFGTQLIGDNGTQAYTPGKYGLYISTGAHWNTMIESV
jgi:hypothetical protein